jgi:hypothetical protein
MNRSRLPRIVAVVAVAAAAINAVADDWRVYQNDRYGTTIERMAKSFRPGSGLQAPLDR